MRPDQTHIDAAHDIYLDCWASDGATDQDGIDALAQWLADRDSSNHQLVLSLVAYAAIGWFFIGLALGAWLL